jgi:septal ring factor EnvC (AmiA/AmiB activator)
VVFLSFYLLSVSLCAAQRSQAQLEQEKQKLEQSILNTKKLLGKTQEDLLNRTMELRLVEKNLSLREQLVRNIDQQIRSSEQRITELQGSISQMDQRTDILKNQYAEMIVYAYKNRGTINKMMFVFSSNNFYQAMKRAMYLDKIKEVRTRQVQLIKTNKTRLFEEQQELKIQRSSALLLAEEKKKERETLLSERLKQQELFNTVKSEDASLRAKLKDDEAKKNKIQKEIQAAIQREIAAEQERIRKKNEEAARKKKEQDAKNKANQTNQEREVTPKPRDQKQPDFSTTPEQDLAGTNFASNKGRLPHPVATGTIVERFGRHAHPTISNVYVDNNGVDISTNRGADVRSVFEGEVSSVISIPGAGKAVIVSHGNYRTVYANLQDVYVSTGNKVSHKQLLGSLLAQGNISVLHFEIHVIKNQRDVQKLNPELWLSR